MSFFTAMSQSEQSQKLPHHMGRWRFVPTRNVPTAFDGIKTLFLLTHYSKTWWSFSTTLLLGQAQRVLHTW